MKIDFSMFGAGIIKHPSAKKNNNNNNNLSLNLILFIYINPKWIVDLKIEDKTFKLLGKNLRRKFSGPKAIEDFLDLALKHDS